MDDQQKRLLEELLFSGEKKLSFAKLLFFGGLHSSSAFPFPEPSEQIKTETDTVVNAVEQFAAAEINADRIDRDGVIPPAVLKGLAKLGVLGMTAPKEFGGQGKSQYTYSKIMAILARHCSSTALFVNAHQSIGLRALTLFGTPEQKKRWLPLLTSGERYAAFALTEPNAGSDASAVETRATYDPVKKVYRLNGQKQWITNGSLAGVLTVMAQTTVQTPNGPVDKITAFLVTPDMPGFKVKEKALEKMGYRGTWTANLEFNNVEVPEANILGPIGGGLRVCLTVLDYGRTTFGATCAGQARMLLDKAIDRAKTRIQFKRPLATFPLVKRKIATMAALTYAMEATSLLTAGLVDKGEEEFMLEAAILKVFNSDSLWSIIYETMQIYGGRSFFTSEPFERLLRDARLNSIGEGSNEVLRAFIALVGLRDVGLQLKGVKDALKNPFGQFQSLKAFAKQWMLHVSASKVPVKSAQLKEEARRLGGYVRRFAVANVRLLAEYKEEIVEQQLELDRIATIAIALYTATAVISRVDAELTRGESTYLSTAKFYLDMSFHAIDDALWTLFSNDDKQITNLSDELTGTKA